MQKHHLIGQVLAQSIAEQLQIEPGDSLLAVNGESIEDVFDYRFLLQDSYVEVLIEKKDGEQWLLEVEKEPDEDLGLVFESGLMDEYHSCRNKCIFCFIDQMPPGMRPTLYFKDDDSRLSFLQGNYVTLTNLSQRDVERICRYRLSPINISFHTMNPLLRCRMLNNRFAGEALKKVDDLMEAGIRMNGQIVLCKGLNDGDELSYSLRRLRDYLPNLESVSVVPVGLTRYREGLYPLKPFDPSDAAQVIDLIEDVQRSCMESHGTHFVHASDEWYILAGRSLPEAERYDGYLQLENGVGMLRLLLDEFAEALEEAKKRKLWETPKAEGRRFALSVATGRLAYPYIKRMAQSAEEAFPGRSIRVYGVENRFFGEHITVSGLLTGKDLREQLLGKDLGERLLLPENMLRSGEDVFLDDMRVWELEKALQVPVSIVKSSGHDLLQAFLRG